MPPSLINDNSLETIVSVSAVASFIGCVRWPQLRYTLTNKLSRENGVGVVFVSVITKDKSLRASIEVKVFLQRGQNLRRQTVFDLFCERELITLVFD
jgi:hypothetical protein